jgi:hypothetical protein
MALHPDPPTPTTLILIGLNMILMSKVKAQMSNLCLPAAFENYGYIEDHLKTFFRGALFCATGAKH